MEWIRRMQPGIVLNSAAASTTPTGVALLAKRHSRSLARPVQLSKRQQFKMLTYRAIAASPKFKPHVPQPHPTALLSQRDAGAHDVRRRYTLTTHFE